MTQHKKNRFYIALAPALILLSTGCCKLDPKPIKDNEPPPPKYQPHITGSYLKFTSDKSSPSEENLGGADLNLLILEDKTTLPLDIPAGDDEAIVDRNHVSIDGHIYERFAVSGKTYRATKFGAIKMPEQNAIVFAQGYPTDSMPENGVATYVGDSVLHLPSLNFEGKGIFASIVNFSEKRLTVEVDTTDNIASYPITFKGTIRGNTFSSDDKNIISQGGFYGHNAEEMSGYFIKGDDVGAFGGKKKE